MEQWLVENSFNLFGTFIGTGLWFAVFTYREDIKTRRVGNLLTITANHREIWKEFLNNPALARIYDTDADISKHPVTAAERVFVTLVIVHTYSVYCAMNDGLVVKYDELRRDIAEFFSLPVPRAVWRKAKPLQNHDFAAFIESSLK